jgi:hypothetical protein
MNKPVAGPMGAVWKYPLREGLVVHEIPKGAKALYVGGDGEGAICVWFMVDPEQPKEKRAIVAVGTGNPLPLAIAPDYVGTIVTGPFVNHVFAPSSQAG